jgi:hypothetical protein
MILTHCQTAQLGVLRGASTKASSETVKKIYWGALLMNWRVWTITQWLSFHYVPPHLRVLWGTSIRHSVWGAPIISSHFSRGCRSGNGVALWWNAYLSLSQA